MSKTKEAADTKQEYTKQQFLTAKRYAHKRDLLNAILDDGELYPISKVETLIKQYDERSV